MDFFAASGTTGRVCIEEQRHSILVDSDKKLNNYFEMHLKQIETNIFLPQYRVLKNTDIVSVFKEIDFENNKLTKNLGVTVK